MPEVIDAFGTPFHGWILVVIVLAPIFIAIGLALYRVAVLEAREHAEALERIRRGDYHSDSRDVSSSGDDWHVGRVVRAEKP